MLYAVTGRPGEGKSCFAVQHLILKELEEGIRPIYTNIWLHRGKINHYFKELGIKVDLKRLHFLEEDQIRKFWKYSEKNSLMVLDEVGEFFNSMAWRELSIDPEWDPASYARLHRKVGHETYLVVQDLNHIYKQFRDLIGEHIQLVNLNFRKVFGFRLPKVFVAKSYDMIDPKKCIKSHSYRYSTKIFDLYDTTQTYEVNSGVRTKDSKEYKKTEISEEKKKKRLFKALLSKIGERFFGLLIIGAIIGVILVLINTPKFIQKLGSRNSTNASTTSTDSTNASTGIISSGVSNFFKKSERSTGSDRSTDAGGTIIRYDQVAKRRP